jgi:xanthine dehydrogenase YagS FAD-binding subunit
MRPFEYATPTSRQQALGLLGSQWGETAIIAGGTDLLALMKDDVLTPKRLVSIRGLAELKGASVTPRGLRLGALTLLADIAENPQVRQGWPALAQAIDEAASPQIRNMATIGGNMCQRPRCWYFRNGFGMAPKTQDGRDLVAEGDNRYHAILGNDGAARFVSPSTIAPILIAYGATIKLVGPSGPREVALEKFFRVPQSAEEREHDLKPNELVTEILVPPVAGAKTAHYEVRQREAFDWPLAMSAVVLKMQGANVQSARIVLGHVAPVPWVSEEAAQAITGKPINEQTASAAAAAAVAKARPLSRNGYKVKLAGVAVKRALLAAAGINFPRIHTGAPEGGRA